MSNEAARAAADAAQPAWIVSDVIYPRDGSADHLVVAAVPCPMCGKPAGEKCSSLWAHPERYDAEARRRLTVVDEENAAG